MSKVVAGHRFYGVDTPTGEVVVKGDNPYPHIHTAVALRFDVGSTLMLDIKCGSDSLLVCDKRLGVKRQTEQAVKWALRHRWVWSNDTYIAVYREGIDTPCRLFSLASLIEDGNTTLNTKEDLRGAMPTYAEDCEGEHDA